MPNDNKGSTIRVAPEIGRRLKSLAALRGETISDVVNAIVPGHLDEMEREARARYASTEKPARGTRQS